MKAPEPLRADIALEWALNPEVAFLNHGSFGATPRRVMQAQDRWRERIEADPIELLGRRSPDLIEEAKAAVGELLGMKVADFGMVTNATDGIMAMLRSIDLRPEDELLTTNHVYNAIRKGMQYIAGRSGATYREVHVPVPVGSGAQIADVVIGALSERTRLVVIDHVTSPTALIFPVEQIVVACNERGIDVLVDGAHAPGMLPLDIGRLGAAFYAGNLHKWVCGPKGAGFLWVRPDRQGAIHPNVISHNLGRGIAEEFSWQGTRDISAWLAVPDAIAFLREIGWEKMYRHNHEMAVWAHRMLCGRWGVEPLSPVDGRLLGSMATMRLPGRMGELRPEDVLGMQGVFYSKYKVEVPLMVLDDRVYLRVSCQVYNRPEEYVRVGEMIERLIESSDH